MIAKPTRFSTDADRWEAVRTRKADADGAFFFAVRTTGVFCRPTCRSRLPLRRNVLFFETPKAAQHAGYRACRRCHPLDTLDEPKHRKAILKACRTVESSDEAPSLRELAFEAGMSPFHFQRIFKQQVGVSPKQYALGVRTRRFRKSLRRADSVTRAIYDAGFASNSRAYERATQRLGMRPSHYKKGAPGMTIEFAIEKCDLGQLLVAATEHGVCSIALGDDPATLRRGLLEEFANARCTENRGAVQSFITKVLAFVKRPAKDMKLPLDIQGTAFQQRVWQELQRIPLGESRSYQEVAAALGAPQSTRAVAQACAKNRLALAIPCHRVVRADGKLSGYRWGVERKQALLDREASPKTVRTRTPRKPGRGRRGSLVNQS